MMAYSWFGRRPPEPGIPVVVSVLPFGAAAEKAMEGAETMEMEELRTVYLMYG